ncbi:MAG: class I SAM-dependent methyltransferase, partial [Planctomycetota bacterium]
MPKTESELWDWVVDYNQRTTHDRGLTSHYGYHSILDVDLIAACIAARERFEPPIRVLDVGCGSGLALNQLADRVTEASLDQDEFQFWGMGVNRYDEMSISDDRFLHGALNAYDFAGMRFHLVFSVFAFHYMWHKLAGAKTVHNQLLTDGGVAYLHFPGYLVRFGESPDALSQSETDGNRR